MKKNEVLALLHQHRAEIQQRFDVEHLALFGFVARDQMHPGKPKSILELGATNHAR